MELTDRIDDLLSQAEQGYIRDGRGALREQIDQGTLADMVALLFDLRRDGISAAGLFELYTEQLSAEQQSLFYDTFVDYHGDTLGTYDISDYVAECREGSVTDNMIALLQEMGVASDTIEKYQGVMQDIVETAATNEANETIAARESNTFQKGVAEGKAREVKIAQRRYESLRRCLEVGRERHIESLYERISHLLAYNRNKGRSRRMIRKAGRVPKYIVNPEYTNG